MKIYVSVNKKKVEGDKQPDLKVAQIIEINGETQFKDIGGLWKTKSGKGYSGEVLKEAPEVKKEDPVDFDF